MSGAMLLSERTASNSRVRQLDQLLVDRALGAVQQLLALLLAKAFPPFGAGRRGQAAKVAVGLLQHAAQRATRRGPRAIAPACCRGCRPGRG